MRQALECHILEGARGAMPQLEDVSALVEGGDGADGRVVEVPAIGTAHELVDGAVGKVDVERLVHCRGPFGIGQRCQGGDLLDGHGGQLLGDVQSAACG